MRVVCARCGTRRDPGNWYSFCSAVKTTQLRHRWTNEAVLPTTSPAPVVKKDDPVSPSHYSRFKIQPIVFIRANSLSFDQACIIKYILRHDAKNGLEDLQKARNHVNGMIAEFYGADKV